MHLPPWGVRLKPAAAAAIRPNWRRFVSAFAAKTDARKNRIREEHLIHGKPAAVLVLPCIRRIHRLRVSGMRHLYPIPDHENLEHIVNLMRRETLYNKNPAPMRDIPREHGYAL